VKKALAIELGIYVAAIGVVCLFWRMPMVLALCFVVMSILVLCRWHTRSDLFLYSIAFVLGPAAEVVAIHFGAWEYAEPFLLIPLWLPPLWRIAAVVMRRLAETLVGDH
jgi:uncharacterized membrane protein YoaT (DUF817 family)